VLATDRSSSYFGSRVYATWADMRSGRLRIYVSHSDDKGATWSPPQAVDDGGFWNDLARGPDNVAPVIAVNNHGVVGVSWQDRRDNPDDRGYFVRFSASLDGGESWLPSVRVSEVPNVPYAETAAFNQTTATKPAKSGDPIGVQVTDNPWLTQGHTAGLAADRAGGFHPLWVDDRTGSDQIYTARVSVNGAVTKYGDPALDSFQDVSKLSTWLVTDSRFIRADRQLRLTAQINNPSKRTLRDIRLRVFSAESPIADVSTVGSGTYEVASLLKPGAKSQPVKLTFDLNNMRPEYTNGSTVWSLARLNVRILAHSTSR